MSLTVEERQYIRSLPKRLDMCIKLREAKDKALHAALVAEFKEPNEIVLNIAERAMKVIMEERG